MSHTVEVSWIVTTQDEHWVHQPAVALAPLTVTSMAEFPSVILRPENAAQTMDGFGVCFNELGYTALSRLSESDRAGIFAEMFAPRDAATAPGANFTICRMPLGANDFSTEWYSYDEVEGDFALEHFSIEHDRSTLVPFITAALDQQPDLRLWASPWSPPTWMKANKHYAGAQPFPGTDVVNGIGDDQLGAEGTDMFNVAPEYLEAYARYFAKFIEAYRAEGIHVEMVMPQNEFNSAQVFPSATWTPAGLAAFLRVLRPEMRRLGVDVFFGTLERPDPGLLKAVLADPEAAEWLSGVGFQWAGKGAIAEIHRYAPELRLYQTEQECGDGRNDWRFARYTWTLMKHFIGNGTNAYEYWNLALDEGGVSRWGWAQNSLVVVDPNTTTFRYTHEFYLMKHLSAYVQPGATRIEAFSWTGHENQLAFANPDGTVVVVVQNDMAEPMPYRVGLGDAVFEVVLPADSFSTFVLPKLNID
jgi:glucosylceramidase